MQRSWILTVIALLAVTPTLVWFAENGAFLYDSKCSMCHGYKREKAILPAAFLKSQGHP